MFACALLICFNAGRAEAQKATYVTASPALEVPPRDAKTPATSERVTIKGLNFGVGFPLGRASLEFLGGWRSAEIDVDRGGDAELTETRVTNRDIPLVAAIRFAPDCPARWCAEVNAGFGINFSRRSLVRVGTCGTVQQPVLPCTPASVALLPVNKEDPTGFIGGAVTALYFRHLEIGPSLRLWYVRRYRDKTGSSQGMRDIRRTPNNERLEIGFTAIWHFRRR
jgi:hypothetical protein